MPALRFLDRSPRTADDGIVFVRLRESFFFVPWCLGGELSGLGISLKLIARGLLYRKVWTGYNKPYEEASANVLRLENGATTANLGDRRRWGGYASRSRYRLGAEAGENPRRRQRLAPGGYRTRAGRRNLCNGVLESQAIAPDLASRLTSRGD